VVAAVYAQHGTDAAADGAEDIGVTAAAVAKQWA
jgi:hypothetical protein